MFPAKAHGPTVFDLNSVGVDAACCHQAREGLPLFMGMPFRFHSDRPAISDLFRPCDSYPWGYEKKHEFEALVVSFLTRDD
mgnify:CR=1 FL=1